MAFRSRRQQRYNLLIANGLFPFEAYEFSSVPFSHASFLKGLVRDRRRLLSELLAEARFEGWSRTRFREEARRAVAQDYIDKGLVYAKRRRGIIKIIGRPDPWQLFRYYRNEAVRRGKWPVETPRRKRRKKRYDEDGIRIDKGDIKKQKARRRERERNKRLREG